MKPETRELPAGAAADLDRARRILAAGVPDQAARMASLDRRLPAILTAIDKFKETADYELGRHRSASAQDAATAIAAAAQFVSEVAGTLGSGPAP